MRTTLAVFLLCLLAAPLPAENIVLNPSFEVWIDTLGVHLPLGWLSSELAWESTAVRSTESRTGDCCVKLMGRDTAAFVSTITLASPGRHYEFSGWASVPAVVGGSFVIEFLSLRGGMLGNLILLPVWFSTGYREYSQWVTAPESAAFLSVSLATLPGATVYVDDVTVEDTTLGGIEETLLTPVPYPRPRKLLLLPGMSLAEKGQGVEIYDRTGRRIRDRTRISVPGVYFLREKGSRVRGSKPE